MKSSEDDIKKFDSIENGDSSALSDNELQSIQKVDEWMSEFQTSQLKPDFTAAVIHSALVAKRKKSRFRFFSVLLGSMATMVSVVWLSLSLGSDVETPQYIPNFMNEIGLIFDLFSNPKVKQLLIICEAIILLLIADQVFSKFRNIRTSAH